MAEPQPIEAELSEGSNVVTRDGVKVVETVRVDHRTKEQLEKQRDRLQSRLDGINEKLGQM